MQEIKCPHCGETFVVDESGYAQIVQQIRDKEFEKELARREREYEEKKEGDLRLARMEQKAEFDQLLRVKESQLSDKEKMIEQLKAKLQSSEAEKRLAVSDADEIFHIGKHIEWRLKRSLRFIHTFPSRQYRKNWINLQILM